MAMVNLGGFGCMLMRVATDTEEYISGISYDVWAVHGPRRSHNDYQGLSIPLIFYVCERASRFCKTDCPAQREPGKGVVTRDLQLCSAAFRMVGPPQ